MLKLFDFRAAGKFVIAILLAAFLSSSIHAADSPLTRFEDGINDLVYQLSRSVVTIESSSRGMPRGEDAALYNFISTGVIYDSMGHVLTLASAVVGRQQILVNLDDVTLPARVVGIDYQSGLAVLLIPKPIGTPVRLSLQYGCAGQMVLALGNAYGLRSTPSLGFCAGLRPDGMMQFTASITSGTLGGALFNLSGQLLGIITGRLGQGNQGEIGVALPASDIQRIVQYLITNGDRPAGFLGLTTTEIEISPPIQVRYPNRLAKSGAAVDLIGRGLIITNVVAQSPAARAGLAVGDLLYSVDRREISSAMDLARMVRESTPGTILQFEVLRQNDPFVVPVTVGSARFDPYQPPGGSVSGRQDNAVLRDSLISEINALKGTILILEKRLKQLK